MKPIIVMAGTPVDTRMGMDCLSSHGLTGLFCPVSENPNQQTAFQISPMEKKAAAVTALLRTAQAEHGCGKAFIYCNSLSGSVDFGPIARETGLKNCYAAGRVPPAGAPVPFSGGDCRQRAGDGGH